MKNLNFLNKYKVILIFLLYIFFISFFIYTKTKESFMLIFMGLFFILFSFFKIIHLKEFKASFSKYDLIAKNISFYGFVYPFIEVVLGCLFLLNYQIKILCILTILILTSTTIGIFLKLRRGTILECACLGVVFKIPLSNITIFENLVMIAMSVILLI